MITYPLTATTLEILKNFANINPQAWFVEGTHQRACNPSRNFIADVELSDALPTNCAIFELNRLLGVIDTVKGDALPILMFGESSLTLAHDHGKVTIPYAHPSVVAQPPTAQFFMDREIASFDLPATLWNKIKRTASILDTKTLHIIINDNGLALNLVNEKEDSSTSGWGSFDKMPNTVVTDTTDNKWAIKFDVLELLPGDYKVQVGDVSNGKASLFGVFLTLQDPTNTKKVTYITSGHVVKTR